MVRISIVVFSILSMSGCIMMRSEGDRIMSEMRNLKNDVAALEKSRHDFESTIELAFHRLEGEFFSHKKRRLNVNFESDMLREEVQTLMGRIESLENQASRDKVGASSVPTRNPLKKEIGAPKLVKNPGLKAPTRKKPHFEWAKQYFDDKEFELSIQAFGGFVKKYPDDTVYVPDAYYWRGEAFYVLAKKAIGDSQRKEFYRKSILSYQKILTKFPKANRLVDALYKTGLALEGLSYARDAVAFYEEIIEKYPNSKIVASAKKRLAVLKSSKRIPTPPKSKKKK